MICDNHTFNSDKDTFNWDKNITNNFTDKEYETIVRTKIPKNLEKSRPDKVRSKSEFIGNGNILSWNEESKIELEKPKFSIKKRNPNMKSINEYDYVGTKFNKSMMTSKDNIFYSFK
jgi:hypothetical protein